MDLSIEERVFLAEYVFQEVRRNLLKISQKHLYLIATQFVDLLRNSVKQAQCETPNEVGERPSKLNDKKLMDISDTMLRSHCVIWRKRKITGLQ
jgi:hypothetical protein